MTDTLALIATVGMVLLSAGMIGLLIALLACAIDRPEYRAIILGAVFAGITYFVLI